MKNLDGIQELHDINMGDETMADKGHPSRRLIGLTGFIALGLGLWMLSPACLGGGAVAICFVALSMRVVKNGDGLVFQSRIGDRSVHQRDGDAHAFAIVPSARREAAREAATDTETLVEEMLAGGRSALLLRPQIIGNLDANQIERATEELDETMCLVPSGPVRLLPMDDVLEEDAPEEDRLWKTNGNAASVVPPGTGRLLMVDSLFIDQYAVTNESYQKFVDDGGYEQLSIWDEESLPAMLDFVDQTGCPGPRFWANERHPENEANHPVVGVSWFEARAFSRWCGKRLPTDAEWTKAGAWPVESSPGCLAQRRFPWGESFDAVRANIWGSGPDGIVAADCFDGGISVGGANQLIGNVWEWTAGPFGDPDDATLRLPTPMKSLRGGAFDTYFENQATCHFCSGDSPLARRHNIGFRLAIGTCDLAPEATGLSHAAPAPIHAEDDVMSNMKDDFAEEEAVATVGETIQ